jgi:hypothetical protein
MHGWVEHMKRSDPHITSLPTPLLGGRTRIRSSQPLDGTLGSIFSGIVEILAVIPETSCESLAMNSHSARPSSSATYKNLILVPVHLNHLEDQHTSTI